MFLPQAMALAKLQEDKLHDRRKGSYSYSQPAFITTPSTYVSNPPASPTINPAFPSTPTPHLPFKRLSSEELAVHRNHGLCYHCDEQWTRGHQCNTGGERHHYGLQYFLSSDTSGHPGP